MARPRENGVAYFPLDVDNDDKLDLIEAEFGLTGFAVIVKLYQRIYKLGYYCEWNEEVALLFGKRLGLGGSAVSEIVSAAIRRALFDAEIYKKYGVLTSRGIQKRYFEIVSRRKNVEVEKRFLLINATQCGVNVNIMSTETPVNVNTMYAETLENAYRSTQSKVKESKVNKSKGKETSSAAAALDNPFATSGDDRPSFDTIEAYATNNLQHMSYGNMEELVSYKNDMPDEIIRYAIDEACANGVPRWQYARAMLARWRDAGYKSLGDIKSAQAAWKASKPSGKPQQNMNYQQHSYTDSDFDNVFYNPAEDYKNGLG